MHSAEFMLMGPEPWYRSLITTKGRHVQTPSPVQGGQRHRREHFSAPYILDANYRSRNLPPSRVVRVPISRPATA
jgi:hypothetical protein